MAPIVDVHVHAVPPALLKGTGDDRFDGVTVITGERSRFSFPNMAPSPPMPQKLFDFDQLETDSADQGITTRLVGPWTDLLGYTLPPTTAEAWTRFYNQSLVEACTGRERLEALGTVPLQHPGLAAEEVYAAADIGCRGLVIGTDIPELDLASRKLDPIWEAAATLSMPILVHPTFLRVPGPLRSRGLKNSIGRAGATATALTRFVYADALARHPSLILIIAHGGGGFVPQLRRVIRNQELGYAETDADIHGAAARLYWDSVVLDPRFLRYLVDTMGADKVLMGSDYPFPWEPHPVKIIRDAALPAPAERAILGGTGQRLFGL